MIHSLQWLCSFEFGLEPSFAASTRLLIFKPKASVGGEKKKNVVSVDSFLISHNYPLLFVHTEPFHVFLFGFLLLFGFCHSFFCLFFQLAA